MINDKNQICCINIIGANRTLLNRGANPILYYWDGNMDIKTSMMSSDDFVNFLKQEALNIYNYCYSSISFVSYAISNMNEMVDEHTFILKEMFPLDKNLDVADGILTDIIGKMYYNIFNIELSSNETMTYIDGVNKILEKMSDKITIRTIINYIRESLKSNGFDDSEISEVISRFYYKNNSNQSK